MVIPSNTELILTDAGRIYHLRLLPEEVADIILLVGDPERVGMVSAFFDSIDVQVANREMVTHTGYYKNTRFTVVSTGIGPDNIDIVMNELDALVNMDLERRQPKPGTKKLKMVRIGTSGAIRKEVPVNSIVVSTHGIGLDGLIYFYRGCSEIVDQALTTAFLNHMNWPGNLSKPYIVKGDPGLTGKLGDGFISGMTVTAPGFYGPQGREVRLRLTEPGVNDKLAAFNYRGNKILNYEMETAALFGLGSLMGHQTASVCLIMANRVTGEYTKYYKESMGKLIPAVLDRLLP
jgi:uridine phosphorylase